MRPLSVPGRPRRPGGSRPARNVRLYLVFGTMAIYLVIAVAAFLAEAL